MKGRLLLVLLLLSPVLAQYDFYTTGSMTQSIRGFFDEYAAELMSLSMAAIAAVGIRIAIAKYGQLGEDREVSILTMVLFIAIFLMIYSSGMYAYFIPFIGYFMVAGFAFILFSMMKGIKEAGHEGIGNLIGGIGCFALSWFAFGSGLTWAGMGLLIVGVVLMLSGASKLREDLGKLGWGSRGSSGGSGSDSGLTYCSNCGSPLEDDGSCPTCGSTTTSRLDDPSTIDLSNAVERLTELMTWALEQKNLLRGYLTNVLRLIRNEVRIPELDGELIGGVNRNRVKGEIDQLYMELSRLQPFLDNLYKMFYRRFLDDQHSVVRAARRLAQNNRADPRSTDIFNLLGQITEEFLRDESTFFKQISQGAQRESNRLSATIRFLNGQTGVFNLIEEQRYFPGYNKFIGLRSGRRGTIFNTLPSIKEARNIIKNSNDEEEWALAIQSLSLLESFTKEIRTQLDENLIAREDEQVRQRLRDNRELKERKQQFMQRLWTALRESTENVTGVFGAGPVFGLRDINGVQTIIDNYNDDYTTIPPGITRTLELSRIDLSGLEANWADIGENDFNDSRPFSVPPRMSGTWNFSLQGTLLFMPLNLNHIANRMNLNPNQFINQLVDLSIISVGNPSGNEPLLSLRFDNLGVNDAVLRAYRFVILRPGSTVHNNLIDSLAAQGFTEVQNNLPVLIFLPNGDDFISR